MELPRGKLPFGWDDMIHPTELQLHKILKCSIISWVACAGCSIDEPQVWMILDLVFWGNPFIHWPHHFGPALNLIVKITYTLPLSNWAINNCIQMVFEPPPQKKEGEKNCNQLVISSNEKTEVRCAISKASPVVFWITCAHCRGTDGYYRSIWFEQSSCTSSFLLVPGWKSWSIWLCFAGHGILVRDVVSCDEELHALVAS